MGKQTLIILIISCFTMLSCCKRKGCTDPLAANFEEKAKKDDGSCEYTTNGFTVAKMLEDIGNDIILPRYEAMIEAAENLNNSVAVFTADLTETNLVDVQSKLKTAELAWQECSTFEFGPAEDNSLRTHVNTFPTDTTSIENKITLGTYDLSSFLAVGYKGLPAIDYLVNKGLNTEIIQKFQGSANRLTFLKDVVLVFDNDVNVVYNGWASTGDNYINTFVSSTGSTVSSSLSLLVNQFNFDYELVKQAKVGIPLGKQTLGVPLPEQCEGYYGEVSSELAQKSLKGLYDLYLGISEQGEDKNGLDDYLTSNNASVLSGDIKSRFDLAISAMEDVPDPMAETIINNQSIVDLAYEEIRKLVVLIKTDMSTEMEVSITYSDGDGD
ncbi:MAG: imelysin family protein [Flavobacteriales bacterium]|nr:imelysin family protein [Flavobacteriales bacterium]